MGRVKQFVERFSEPVFLFIVFWTCQLPLRDFDIWFHIKAGEYFVTHGLTFTDPFSFAANGRTWITFEWLFQVIAYELSKIGLWIIPPFIALFAVAMAYIFLKTLKDVFGVPMAVRLPITFLFIVSGLDYMTARPHMMAYTFLFLELSLILYRLFRGKRYLYALPLVTLVWTNVHSTGFLSWGMLATYAAIVGFSYLVTKKKSYLPILKDFVIVGAICAAITILPPKGTRDYELLWQFFINRKLLADFIAEWAPPFEGFVFGFILYTFFLILAAAGTLFVTIKTKRWIEYVWTVPFLILGCMGYTASRNVFLGLYGSIFLLGWTVPYLIAATPQKYKKIVWGGLCCILIVSQCYLFTSKRQVIAGERRYFPVQSAAFAKKYLHGHMFNEYSYGGYMLYVVYPQLQVFIDGRAEVYLCCEIHDYIKLSENKYLPDAKYKQFLDTFFDAYTIDFAIIGVQKHIVMRRIGELLSRDPNWALVFWDDNSEIFVKKNGKNDAIIKQLEAKSATPYLRDPFPPDKVEQAQFEYERMDQIAPSARTSNALGYIYELEGDLETARQRFLDATARDPTFESPYMNLAELAVHDGNTPAAVALYQKALTLAPDRGLIYIRLGQLTLVEFPQKADEVKKLWQDGLKNTVDMDAKTQLKKLIQEL